MSITPKLSYCTGYGLEVKIEKIALGGANFCASLHRPVGQDLNPKNPQEFLRMPVPGETWEQALEWTQSRYGTGVGL